MKTKIENKIWKAEDNSNIDTYLKHLVRTIKINYPQNKEKPIKIIE